LRVTEVPFIWRIGLTVKKLTHAARVAMVTQAFGNSGGAIFLKPPLKRPSTATPASSISFSVSGSEGMLIFQGARRSTVCPVAVEPFTVIATCAVAAPPRSVHMR
jgi:hypothetical protein